MGMDIIGVGFHSLLQGIFLTQGLKPCLLHCRQILYHLSNQGSVCVCVCVYIYIYMIHFRVQLKSLLLLSHFSRV